MANRWGTPARVLLAAVLGLAVWSAAGLLTMTSAAPGASRIGLLPPWWSLGACVAAAAVLTFTAARRGVRLAALGSALLALVPWSPWPVPAAALLWTGPTSLFLFAIACAAFVSTIDAPGAARFSAWFGHARRAPWLAGVCAFAVFVAVSARVAPVVPGGDEPHYLIITQSLLNDGDLRIENNHQRGDYLAYVGGTLRPDYLRRGQDRQIYSIHLPGISALVLPAFAMGGHALVKLFLALLSACGAWAVWRAAHTLTRRADAAWFAWAATALTAPFLFLAFTVYPDGAGGVIVAFVLALLVALETAPGIRPPWWWGLAGAGAAVLPWLHPRCAGVAAALGAVFLARAWHTAHRLRTVLAFVAVPVLSACGWFAYYLVIYGSPNPSVAYGHYTQMAVTNAWRGLVGLAVDQQFGVVATAPAYAAVAAGLVVLARTRRRLAIEWAVVVVPYVVTSAMYHMWWGGHSSPGRFLGVVMLACGIPMAAAWAAARRTSDRVLLLSLLAVSLALAGVMAWVGRGQLVFNTRDGFAAWALWASRIVDVPRALPSVFRSGPVSALAVAALWGAAVAGAWIVSRMVERRWPAARARVALAFGLVVAVGAAVAASSAWSIENVRGPLPVGGQLALLRAASSRPDEAAWLLGAGRAAPAGMAVRELTLDGMAAPGRPPWAWLWAPDLPAGTYRALLSNRVPGAALDAGVVIGRGDHAIETWSWRDTPPGTVSREIVLPAAVRSLALKGAGDARAMIRGSGLQVLHLAGAGSADGRVGEARRYGDVVVMAVGDGAWLEPEGAWTRGGQTATFVVDRAGGPTKLRIRAGVVPVAVSLERGGWREQRSLAAGETLEIDLPEAPSGTPLRVTTDRGFRPSEVEPGSTDTRVLGAWLEFR